jgi:hypothetical protein
VLRRFAKFSETKNLTLVFDLKFCNLMAIFGTVYCKEVGDRRRGRKKKRGKEEEGKKKREKEEEEKEGRGRRRERKKKREKEEGENAKMKCNVPLYGCLGLLL